MKTKKLSIFLCLVMVATVFAVSMPGGVGGEYTSPEGLISYWKLDETSGTNAKDSVGDNHGTLINGPVWTAGQVNGGLYFDGSNDYVNVGLLPITPSWTIEVWAMPDLALGTGEKEILSGGLVNDFEVPGGVFKIYVSGWLSSGVTLQSGNWYHLSATYDGTTLKLFINGEEKASTVRSISSPGGYTYLGRFMGGNHFYGGLIDEVAIWDRALTLDEINNHYINGLVGDSYVNLPMMAVQELFDEFQELSLPQGTENSLLSKLDAALNCLDNGNDNAAINILNAFKNSVEAQREKKITAEQADYLIEAADDILATI
jgi:hypothetical protein